jgi:deoxyribonucleoside regulator
MQDQRNTPDRASLLAEVAELYYLEGKDQSQIAAAIGVTRSMISRMLKEARASGIVEIRVHRASDSDPGLENQLQERFGLLRICVTRSEVSQNSSLIKQVGACGAQLLAEYVKPGTTIGLAWGIFISATVDAFDDWHRVSARVVQLGGAVGASYVEYDGYGLVMRLAQKIGGEPYFLNAPFYCPAMETVQSLLETPAIKESIEIGKQAQVALLGVGSTERKYSSFYRSGYIPTQEIDQLLTQGAVGNVCGVHFNIHGESICEEFSQHLVVIHPNDLLSIPVRIGVAGGPGKAVPLLGALRGGFINVLATDAATARKVLELAGPA